MKNTGSWNANFSDYLLIKLKNTNGKIHSKLFQSYTVVPKVLKTDLQIVEILHIYYKRQHIKSLKIFK